MHRAYSSVVLVLGLLACAGGGHHAALGWSLGGEAHVFIADDRFARDTYRQLTGKNLMDTLEGRPLVAVDARGAQSATVLSASGAAPARLTLARFHAPRTCGGDAGVVTELVLAFPPSGAAGRSTPPSHVTVVALLDASPFAGAASRPGRALSAADARTLIRHVAERAETSTRGTRLGLLHPLSVDADQAADAGEVAPVGARYAVGFRATFVATDGENKTDTTLITGVATTDVDLRELRWVVRPQRQRLHGGAISQGLRYSLRGSVAAPGGGVLLLVDEISDAELRASRAMAVNPDTRRVVAAQPLALRCP